MGKKQDFYLFLYNNNKIYEIIKFSFEYFLLYFIYLKGIDLKRLLFKFLKFYQNLLKF